MKTFKFLHQSRFSYSLILSLSIGAPSMFPFVILLTLITAVKRNFREGEGQVW